MKNSVFNSDISICGPFHAGSFHQALQNHEVYQEYLDQLSFLEIETPFLTKSTPESKGYLVPRISGQVLFAPPITPTVQAADDERNGPVFSNREVFSR
jgi:hypothetical protein